MFNKDYIILKGGGGGEFKKNTTFKYNRIAVVEIIMSPIRSEHEAHRRTAATSYAKRNTIRRPMETAYTLDVTTSFYNVESYSKGSARSLLRLVGPDPERHH